MKKPFSFFLILFLGVLSITEIQAQDSNLVQDAVKQMRKFFTYFPQEKVYIHLDRNVYYTGDDIWFKAYLTDGSLHLPDTLSRILYVDLLDQKGKLISTKKLIVDNGFSQGDFKIDKSLISGHYQVKAYTNWMRNFNPGYFFTENIEIFNLNKEVAPQPTLASMETDLQFFPEGGYLVEGLPCRIAFKVTDQYGKGLEVSGTIKDQTGNEVTPFNTIHNGMGAFMLLAQPGVTYVAEYEVNGEIQKTALPSAFEEGYNLLVNNSSDEHLTVILKAKATDLTKTKYADGVILSQMRGIVNFMAKADLSSGSMVYRIPKKEFPNGIAQITFIDGEGVPQCERIFFVDHGREAVLKVVTDKRNYSTRELVEVELELEDANGKSINGNLSLSVSSLPYLLPNHQHKTIRTSLLLTSDLKGHIEDPEFYFSDTENASRALDMLMLTQGYRRFEWKKILKDEMPETSYFLEQGLYIGGKVFKANGDPAANSRVTLFIKGDQQPGIKVATTDQEGNFGFAGLNLYGRQTLSLQAERKNFDIRLDSAANLAKNLVFPTQGEGKIENVAMLKNELVKYAFKVAESEENLEEKVLEDVTVEAEAINQSPGAIYQIPDATINLEKKEGNFPNLFEAIRGAASGMQVIREADGSYNIKIRGGSLSLQVENEAAQNPLYLLDGVYVDQQTLLEIDINDVSKIDLLTSPGNRSLFGSRGANGVIAVYTKRGANIQEDPVATEVTSTEKGTVNLQFQGFSRTRTYYSPKYDQRNQSSESNNDGKDYRATVFWEPEINLNSKGKATISFYTSDEINQFQGIVNGLTYDGKPVNGSFSYTTE